MDELFLLSPSSVWKEKKREEEQEKETRKKRAQFVWLLCVGGGVCANAHEHETVFEVYAWFVAFVGRKIKDFCVECWLEFYHFMDELAYLIAQWNKLIHLHWGTPNEAKLLLSSPSPLSFFFRFVVVAFRVCFRHGNCGSLCFQMHRMCAVTLT